MGACCILELLILQYAILIHKRMDCDCYKTNLIGSDFNAKVFFVFFNLFSKLFRLEAEVEVDRQDAKVHFKEFPLKRFAEKLARYPE